MMVPLRAAFHYGLLGLLLLASGCGVSPNIESAPPASPAAAATAMPTTPAVPTQLPTNIPTAAPTQLPTNIPTAVPQDELLPAPLFALFEGQIWRIERDGVTRRQMTFEPRPVRSFDIRLADNALVYLTGDADWTAASAYDPDILPIDRSLTALDGGGRAVLARGPFSVPLFRPGGDRITFRVIMRTGLISPVISDAPTGIWSVVRAGRAPVPLLLDAPTSDPSLPPEILIQYDPVAWSPDGSRLLISVYPGVGEAAWLAILNNDATFQELEAGCCGDSIWSPDSMAIYLAGGLGVQDASLGLWRIDATNGGALPLLPASIDNRYVLTAAPFPAPDGGALAFLALADEAPEVDPAALGPLILTHIAPDGTRTALRPDDDLRFARAVWSPDGAGAVALTEQGLAWLPADGSPPTIFAPPADDVRWGSTDAPPATDACTLYQELVWQPPDARNASDAVFDVQSRLFAQGFVQVGAPDGYYGDATRAAVIAFQQSRGLPADGNVDCATWQALLAP